MQLSTPRSVSLRGVRLHAVLAYFGFSKNVGLYCNSSRIFFKKLNFFHSKQGEACKDKIVPGKTPRRLTLREVRLRVALANFGFSKNIRIFFEISSSGF